MRTSLKRKKHQQVINKIIRAMNKNIYNDPAWFGRFVIRQIHSDFYRFEDKSGGMMFLYCELVDKKTKKIKLVKFEESQFLDADIWFAVNRFICEDIGTAAWKEDVVDYRNVEAPAPHSLKWWRNYR